MVHKHFSSLSSLRQLDLSNNPNIYINLGNIAGSLRKTSIRILRLNNTGIGNPPNPTSILIKFCNLSLEELTLDNNFIHHLGPIFRDCFPNMRILSLADNYLLTNLHVIRNIMFLENLVGLNFSYQNTLSHSRPNENRYDRLVLSRRKREEHMCMKDMACPLVPPPNLLWIDLSHSGLFTVNVPKIVLLSNSTLKYFKASVVEFKRWLSVLLSTHPHLSVIVCPSRVKLGVLSSIKCGALLSRHRLCKNNCNSGFGFGGSCFA